MTPQSSLVQRGFGLFAVFFWIVLFGVIFMMGMRLTPIFTEYYAVKSSLTRAKNAGSEANVRQAFDTAMTSSYGAIFTSQDLVFQNQNGQNTVGFAYERKLSLLGPASLLFEFSDNQYTQ